MARIHYTAVRVVLSLLVLLAASCGQQDLKPGEGGGTTGSSGGSGGSGGGTPPPPVASGIYTIAWDTVGDPSVTGYRIYYGTAPINTGPKPNVVDVDSSTTSLDIDSSALGISAGTTIYVVVSSTGASGLESPVSPQTSILVQ